MALPDPEQLNDIVSIQIQFENGAIGAVHYFSNGDKAMPKESVEVFQNGQSFRLDDFRTLERYSGGRVAKSKSAVQNKGQAAMVERFLERIRDGGKALIPFAELFGVHAACFAALESIKTGSVVKIRNY